MSGRPALNLSLLPLFWCCLLTCVSPPESPGVRTIADIPPPRGCRRVEASRRSDFAAWLCRLPLKGNNEIMLHSGEINTSHRFDVLAVVDKPLLFRENLEECVDFCLRLWADYHFDAARLDRLYLFDRNGRKVFFSATADGSAALKTGSSEEAYLDFLKAGLAWTNPFSVAQGTVRLTPAEARAGDLVLQTEGRDRGQASLILDQCMSREGRLLFLIGFGFSPAQEFHIEKAPPEFGQDGWFALDGYVSFLEKYYALYGKPMFARF